MEKASLLELRSTATSNEHAKRKSAELERSHFARKRRKNSDTYGAHLSELNSSMMKCAAKNEQTFFFEIEKNME